MITKHILLEKGKITGLSQSTHSAWKIMALASVFCFVITLLNGCGEPNLDDPKVREQVLAEAIDEDSLQTRRAPSGEELRYAPNQERPYAGWVKDGRELYQFQNGKRNGLYINWYSNNQNYQKGIFRDGKEDGLWTTWYENGQKGVEVTYKDGNIDGLVTQWHENGQKGEEGTYKDGLRNGLWTTWYENGQKGAEGTYKDGNIDGLVTQWHENGQKQAERTYKDGKEDGLWIEWDENGKEVSRKTH